MKDAKSLQREIDADRKLATLCAMAHSSMYLVYSELLATGKRAEADAVMVACADMRKLGHDAANRAGITE